MTRNIQHARRRHRPTIITPLIVIALELAGIGVLLWMLAGAVI